MNEKEYVAYRSKRTRRLDLLRRRRLDARLGIKKALSPVRESANTMRIRILRSEVKNLKAKNVTLRLELETYRRIVSE